MSGSLFAARRAGVLLHLMRQGWTADAIEKLLYKQSGLLGVSGLSADMRTLRASTDPRAAQAIAQFNIAQVFQFPVIYDTMTVAENLAFPLRNRQVPKEVIHKRAGEIAEELEMSAQLNQRAANLAADGNSIVPIHAADSRVEIWVVPTDEGRVAARDALALTTTSADLGQCVAA